MRALFLFILILLSSSGCARKETVAATPTPRTDLELADDLFNAQDYEGAALAYRDILDRLERTNAPSNRQRSVREKCTRAMVEAGGFADSRRLWSEMVEKNPESKMEARRMQARAERMMLMQGEELLQQAADDLAQGHRSKALATAKACHILFEDAGADETQTARSQEMVRKLQATESPRET